MTIPQTLSKTCALSGLEGVINPYSNHAGLSRDLYRDFFENKKRGEHFVEISGRVYTAVCDGSLKKTNTVWLNPVQRKDCDPQKKWRVEAAPFIPPEVPQRFCRMRQATFRLFVWEMKKPFKFELQSLRAIFLSRFCRHYLAPGQNLLVHCGEAGAVRAEVDSFYPAEKPLGLLVRDTAVDFEVGEGEPIEVVEKGDEENYREFVFKLLSLHHEGKTGRSWKEGGRPLPLMVSKEWLERGLRCRLAGAALELGKEFSLEVEGMQLKLCFDALREAEKKPGDGVEWQGLHDEKRYAKEYTLKFHDLRFLNSCSRLLLTTPPESAREALELKFEIVGHAKCASSKENQRPYVSLEELRREIAGHRRPLCIGGRITVKTATGIFLLELLYAEGTAPQEIPGYRLSELFKIVKKTAVKVVAPPEGRVAIVDSAASIPLKRILVNVDIEEAKEEKGLLALFQKEKKRRKKTAVQKEELERHFRKWAPRYFLEGQKVQAIGDRGERLTYSVIAFDYNNQACLEMEYGRLFKLEEKTQVVLQAEESAVSIASKPPLIQKEEFGPMLRRFGIGGMGKKLEKILHQIYLPRKVYPERSAAVGIPLTKGMVFHGPPGTGKSLVAGRLADLLGCGSQNRAHVGAHELLSKWHGETEKRIREHFERARRAEGLYCLVIDEGDTIARDREKATQNHHVSITNAFLNVIDGLEKGGWDPLGNLVVVLITNRFDNLDEALIRPGRLGTHIEFGYPDYEARKEIIQIQAENYPLSAAVTPENLARKTAGMSGADISSLFTLVESRIQGKLNELGIKKEEALISCLGRARLSDFDWAIRKKQGGGRIQRFDYSQNGGKLEGQLARYFEERRFVLTEGQLNCLAGIYAARTIHFKEHCQNGDILPRALFLYGGPGTGKTELSKLLEGVFGQFYCYLADPDISIEKMEPFLLKAKHGAKDLKEESPPFLLVLDGIEHSAVKSLVSRIEQRFDEKRRNSHNLFIVGIVKGLAEAPLQLPRGNRFGIHLKMEPLKRREREKFISLRLEKKACAENFDLGPIAARTENYTGSELEALIASARGAALGRPDKKLTTEDFLSRIALGEERLSFYS